MIVDALITVIITILTGIFGFLPVVTVADIPVVGSQISSTLLWVVLKWNAFLDTFPYATIVWQIFLYVILPFELLLLLGKFFLGHRLPAHTNN